MFAITFGTIFAFVYGFVMNNGWQLFTYYPALGQWTALSHAPTVAAGTAAGPAMKWYGYVATCALVALVCGIIACLIPPKILQRVWWPGFIWLLPICAMIAVTYLIAVVGD